MRPRPFVRLLLVLALALLSTAGRADDTIAFDAGRFDPAATWISLLNVGASDDEPWMSGGHLVLRVHDGFNDYAFDWGIFDDTEQNFLVNYLLGVQDFEHLVRPTAGFLGDTHEEGRSVLERPLTLTLGQRARLLAVLHRWAQPGNRRYRYRLLDRNCSTSVRDLLVEVLGDRFAAKLKEPWPDTIRSAGLARLGYFPIVDVLTTVAGGPVGDLPGTRASLFYLPVLVPKLLADVPAYDDQGQPVTGRMLLGPPSLLLAGSDVPANTTPWAALLGISLALPLALAAGALARWPRLARLLGGLALLAGGLATGLLGVVIDLLWGVTQHTFTWDNANVGLFWPVDLVLVGLAVVYARAAVTARAAPAGARRLLRWLAMAHLAVAALLLLARIVGVVKQDLSETLLGAGVFWGCCLGFAWLEGRDRAVPGQVTAKRRPAPRAAHPPRRA